MYLGNGEPVVFWTSLNPFEVLSLVALTSFIWGLQAAVGANTGYRRNLEWQTGFILSLLTSGLLVSLLYSIRPLASSRLASIAGPKWLRVMSRFPLIVVSSLSILLALAMLINSGLAPIAILTTDWTVYSAIGAVLAAAAAVCFTCLGGYLGKSWFHIAGN